MVQIFENFGVLLQIIVLLLILFMQIENYGHNLLGGYVFSKGKKVIIILCHYDDFRTFQIITMLLHKAASMISFLYTYILISRRLKVKAEFR